MITYTHLAYAIINKYIPSKLTTKKIDYLNQARWSGANCIVPVEFKLSCVFVSDEGTTTPVHARVYKHTMSRSIWTSVTL